MRFLLRFPQQSIWISSDTIDKTFSLSDLECLDVTIKLSIACLGVVAVSRLFKFASYAHDMYRLAALCTNVVAAVFAMSALRPLVRVVPEKILDCLLHRMSTPLP